MKGKKPKGRPARKDLALLALIAVFAFAVRLALFSGSGYVSGDDGGYYAYYTKEALDWRVGLGSSPVFFYASAFFSLFFGVNSGVTIATCMFSSLAGVAIFILAQHLFNDVRISLIAAFLAVFSALGLSMDADLRKSVAAAFFIPMFFYFLLRALEGRKHLLPAALCGALALLSHKTSFAAGFVLIAYILLLFVLRKEVPKKEIIAFAALLAAVLAAVAALMPSIAGELHWLAPPPLSISSGLQGLSALLLPLLVFSLIGAAVCLKRRAQNDVFIISWALSFFALALPQAMRSDAYRFAYLLVFPLSMLSAVGLIWACGRFKSAAKPLIIALLVLSLTTFLLYGLTARPMKPVPYDYALQAIEELSHRIPEGSKVYSNIFRNGALGFWVNGYFFGRGEEAALWNINGYMNMDFAAGKEVYYIYVEPYAIFEDAPEGMAYTPDPSLRIFYNKSGVRAYKMAGKLPEYDSVYTGVSRDYDYGRLAHLTTYLVLPCEIIYMLNPPYLAVFQAAAGIPLSILWIGFLLNLMMKRALKLKRRNQHAAIIALSAAVIIALIIKPGFL